MPRMVCMKCQLFLHPKKTGVIVEEGMPQSSADKPGEGNWLPYKLWSADSWECRGCGVEIIAGFAAQHFAEHYEKNYGETKKRLPPYIFVKDCL